MVFRIHGFTILSLFMPGLVKTMLQHGLKWHLIGNGCREKRVAIHFYEQNCSMLCSRSAAVSKYVYGLHTAKGVTTEHCTRRKSPSWTSLRRELSDWQRSRTRWRGGTIGPEEA